MKNKNIFVACDVSSQKEILDLLELIHKDISGIKIGLQYITQRSPEEIRELSKFKKPIFYDGKFFDIKQASISPKSIQQPHVPIYIGGESEQGFSLAAKVADIYLFNGRPPDQITDIVTNMKQRADKHERTLRFGMSAFVICRESEEEAQAEFQRLLSLLHTNIKGGDKEVKMHKILPDDVKKVGTNGGTVAGLVGTPNQIAERLHEFESLGVETFLLQFHPSLEELDRFGTEVMPLL